MGTSRKPSLDAFRSYSSEAEIPPTDQYHSRRGSIASSIGASSIGGILDFSTPSLRLPAVAEGSQNAISTLLQPPIVRTGLMPMQAPSGTRVPNTRDIPTVALTNIPSVDTNIFRPYMAQVASLYEARGVPEDDSGSLSPIPQSPRPSIPSSPTEPAPPMYRRKSSNSIRKAQLSVPPLSSIPGVYFDESFHLENPRIFDVVTERSEVIRTPVPEDLVGETPRKALATNAILQEKLSWYLDTVEIHLISAISSASKSFFAALGSLKELHREASDSVGELQKLRADLKHLDEDMAMGRLDLVRLNQRRQNVYKLSCATLQLSNVIKAASYCEELVDQGQLENSLEKIGALEDYVCGFVEDKEKISWITTELLDHLIDLRKLKALEGFGRGMNQLREKIGIGYQQKFTEILLADLRDHVNKAPVKETLHRWSSGVQRKRGVHGRTGSIVAIEPLTATTELREKLSQTLLGLKRSKYTLAATAAFKDSVNKEMKRIIRQNLPSASDDDTESMASTSTRSSRITLSQHEKSAVLARNLRALDPQDAEELLLKAYCGVGEALRRLQFQFKLLLDISSDQSVFKSPIRTQFMGNLDATVTTNGLRSPSPNLQDQLSEALDLSSLLGQAVDVAQSQLIKVLKVRSEQVITLDLKEFLRYFTLNKLFADECEALSGRSGASLKGVINNQISDFIVKFAEMERITLGDLMEKDRWDARGVSEEDEKVLNEILECRDTDPTGFLSLAFIWEDDPEPVTNGTSHSNGVTVVQTGIVRPAVVEDESYILPHSAILLLHGVARFLTLIACMPAITSDVSLSLLDYLKIFNSKSCQLVLGAGATRSAAKLDKINTKHLALASQALAFAVALVPYIREFIRRKPGMSSLGVGEYDRVRRLLTDHLVSIHDKLIEIMASRAAIHVNAMDTIDWDIDQGRSPSRHMETAIKETSSLQRVLAKHMPEASVRGIVEPVFAEYKRVWGEAFEKAQPKTNEGKERLLKDAEAFRTKLGDLFGGKEVGDYLVNIAKEKQSGKTET